MSIFRKIVVVLFVALVFSPSVNAEGCIGVAMAGSSLNFWRLVHKGALEAGEEFGYDILVRGPMEETNEGAQVGIVKSMIARGCVGLVIAPASRDVAAFVDSKAVTLPVVYIDRDYGGNRMSVVKTENFRAGVLAGQKMAEILGGKGRVALFRNDTMVITTHTREEGFRKGATEGGLNVVLETYVGVTVGDARSKAYLALQQEPALDGLFTSNEPTTMGTFIALDKARREGIVHIGFDANQQILEGLVQGTIHTVISQRPREMGYRGVEAMVALLSGQPYDRFVDTGIFFVNKESLHQLSTQAELGP